MGKIISFFPDDFIFRDYDGKKYKVKYVHKEHNYFYVYSCKELKKGGYSAYSHHKKIWIEDILDLYKSIDWNETNKLNNNESN